MRKLRDFFNRFKSPRVVAAASVLFPTFFAASFIVPLTAPAVAFNPLLPFAVLIFACAAAIVASADFSFKYSKDEAREITTANALARKENIKEEEALIFAVKAISYVEKSNELVKGQERVRFSESLKFIEETAKWIILMCREYAQAKIDLSKKQAQYGVESTKPLAVSVYAQRTPIAEALNDINEALTLISETMEASALKERDDELKAASLRASRPSFETVRNEIDVLQSSFEEISAFERQAELKVQEKEQGR